jgi:ferredoxin
MSASFRAIEKIYAVRQKLLAELRVVHQEVVAVKIFIHPAVCDGAARCATIAPEYFAIGTDGKSYVRTQEIVPEDEPKLRTAESSCPYGAIVLLDD